MKKANIIVLAGQSNAVGVGHVEYLPRHFSSERVKSWYDGYKNVKINYFSHDKKSDGFTETLVGCTEISKKTIGPELGIAEALAERYPKEEIFIVKCAFGGMSLLRDFRSPSSGGDYDATAYADQKENIIVNYAVGAPIRCGWCYNELVRITSQSISALKAKGYAPVIKAFCWMQGENEACSPGCTAEYEEAYDNLLKDFSMDFAAYLDNCRYIDAGVSELWPYSAEMNRIKKEYAKNHENCVFIDTVGAGLTTKNEPENEPDIYHYDSDCVIKLGHLFADGIEL